MTTRETPSSIRDSEIRGGTVKKMDSKRHAAQTAEQRELCLQLKRYQLNICGQSKINE